MCVWACSGMGDGVCVLGLVEVLQTHTYTPLAQRAHAFPVCFSFAEGVGWGWTPIFLSDCTRRSFTRQGVDVAGEGIG